MKYINFKRYKFSTIVKNFNTLTHNFLKIFKIIGHERYNFKKIYKYLGVARFNLTQVSKYLRNKIYNIKNIKIYNIKHVKKIEFLNYKFLVFHLPATIIFFSLLYLIIPTFYNYDKSKIEKVICKKQNIECLIKGKVNYIFYPSPRIVINDLVINDFFKKKNALITVERATIELSIKNLLVKERHKFKKIKLNNFEINLNLKNLQKYRVIFKKKINFIPIIFSKGKIIFFDGKDYVATVNNANLNLKFVQSSIEAILKGKFLNDNLYINLSSKKVDDKISANIILKMPGINFLTKANFIHFEKDENVASGNFLIKKGKSKITGIFDYRGNKLIINNSNLRNTFLKGKLEGIITLLPYFSFDLEINLNSLNFTKLYNYFLSLEEKNQKNLFKINSKINGKLNLSADKIYSSYNLVESLESRMKFYNGNISIDQFLLNLGKLGAADVLGVVNNDKKLSNFKFESNIFVDNKKKFSSKFGIYNKQNIPPNLFVSGNFDLKNIRISFYEISGDKIFNSEDVNYIEKEFNDLMLEDGYSNLFHFPRFKDFVKSITSDNN